MTIFIELLLIAMVVGSLTLAGWSVTNIKSASTKPCNGELKQLAHLDGTIKKFHTVIRKAENPKAVMRHG